MKNFHQSIKKLKSGKKKNIVISIIIFTIILSAFFVMNKINNTKDYSYLIADTTKEIVYSLEDANIKENDQVPVINISNEKINEINEDIITTYNDYLGTYKDYFKYEYCISNDILSIIIKSSQRYNDSNNYNLVYKSYNIDLDTLELITDKELFERFKVTEEDLRFFVTYKFINYYNDLVDKGYFTQKECDFSCFIDSKGIEDYLLDNVYYVNNNKLELYKYFNIYTDYHEEKYFNEESFHFIVKE